MDMLLTGIFGANIAKHGLFKGTLGGFIMYPSIFLFVLFQVLFLRLLNRTLVTFNAIPIDRNDYVDYGRVNLADYNWFDRLNCHFCAYANGNTHAVSASLDAIGECNFDALDDKSRKQVEKLLKRSFFWARIVGVSGLGFVLSFEKLLGYKRADFIEIKEQLKEREFGVSLKSKNRRSIYQNAFKLRIIFQSFQVFLSTIESNWCPLTYAKKEYLLAHQEQFIDTNLSKVTAHINKTKENEITPKRLISVD
ncbi:MAG: hypothetical protein V7765_18085 [Oleispira sp.]